jgi:hypothetical protein
LIATWQKKSLHLPFTNICYAQVPGFPDIALPFGHSGIAMGAGISERKQRVALQAHRFCIPGNSWHNWLYP